MCVVLHLNLNLASLRTWGGVSVEAVERLPGHTLAEEQLVGVCCPLSYTRVLTSVNQAGWHLIQARYNPQVWIGSRILQTLGFPNPEVVCAFLALGHYLTLAYNSLMGHQS